MLCAAVCSPLLASCATRAAAGDWGAGSSSVPRAVVGMSCSSSVSQSPHTRWGPSCPRSPRSSACPREQAAQTTRPHWRQWWRRVVKVNMESQRWHAAATASGVHCDRGTAGRGGVLGGGGGPPRAAMSWSSSAMSMSQRK
jgi:hypothetical protein